MYEPRTYRKQFNLSRFYPFYATFRETDLWIGVNRKSYVPEMKSQAYKKVVELRKVLDDHIYLHPDFKKALNPLSTANNFPKEVNEMITMAAKAGIGPMSTVAGLFAQEVGRDLMSRYPVEELVIENGGDIFLKLKEDLHLSVYAGKSPLSEKIGVVIPAGRTPIGICTSAGTVGPSLSFGKADAVMVACKSTSLADAFATAFGNKVQSYADIETVLNYSEQFPEILSLIIICEGKIGIRGNFEVKVLK
ncbi:MAG: UPF0280 family protein [Prolixibacteraceae bacterium]|nr:UPF0280 family protein [Prolixibacteraceae bacterium]